MGANQRPRSTWAQAGVLAIAMAAWPGGACLDPGVFRCTDSRQCEPGGHCESTGGCSYPVASSVCGSGWRYSSHAPDALSNACVQDACPASPVTKVRAGSAHVCEVRGENGAVACWGAGADGQLGDGIGLSRSAPATIAATTLPPTRDIAAGGRHTCALLESGAVWCWGANEAGQLGDGTRSPHGTPAPVRELTGEPLVAVAAIAAGEAFTCAARQTGEVVCWGGNTDGELGQGDTAVASALAPQPIQPISPTSPVLPTLAPGGASTLNAVKLSARDRHICALTSNGAVWCWGSNEQGELGDGSQISGGTPRRAVLPEGIVQNLATGSAHTCAIGAGMLWCWGTNQLGELGDGSNQTRLLPSAVALPDVTDVTAAGHHTCARQSNGAVWCWGANQAGQLGEGTTSNFNVPVPVTGVEDASDITAGDTFSCVRRRNGTVWCWGDDRTGQLGTGAKIDRVLPSLVGDPTLVDVFGVSAGGTHTCAVRHTAAQAVCWGDNQAGQLGDGTRLDRSTPVTLKITLDAEQIVTGALHTCLRSAAGGVWCWGRGGSGQLGNAALIDLILPTRVGALGATTAIAAGRRHTCALMADRTVVCWGANGDGQLGDGTVSDRSTPAPVPGETDVAELAVGGAHTCARHGDGGVSCWGRGGEGQLGDGAQSTSATPVTVQQLHGAVAIAAGGSHSCAILANHLVWCWGDGRWGQLGWGTLAGHAVPSKVMNLSDAVQIAAGEDHTCARTALDGRVESAGSVWCWGDNRVGQLGNGTYAGDRGTGPAPAAPVLLTGDAVAISAGAAHSCAVTSAGTVLCWGSNSAGQLGDAIVLQYPTAQLTASPCP